MSDDYGQFVALDIDIELEPIDSFKLKMKYMNIKPMATPMKNNQMKTNQMNKPKMKYVENINYWYLLGLCVILLF
jgi:hypothetical protein